MYAVALDPLTDLEHLLDTGHELDSLVLVEQAERYPGELMFSPFGDRNIFYSRYRQWMSHHLVLNEIFNLPAFVTQLSKDGYVAVFAPSCEPVLADCMRWAAPLEIEGYDLYPFQQFSLNRAFETHYWFFNWCVGAGKSFACAAGAKELFSRGEVDVVLGCTGAAHTEDLRRFFARAGLDAVLNDGPKAKRRKVYEARHQVYALNYEKLRVDTELLAELIAGRDVLWIFDECHKIVNEGGKPNMARAAYEHLQQLATSTTWVMSASVVDGNPLRFRDTFSIGQATNPLGSKHRFVQTYAETVEVTPMKTHTGKRFELVNYTWNLPKLADIRHRVGSRTQTARQTDPGLKERFKDMPTIVETITPGGGELELQDFIIDAAYEAWGRGESLGPYYHLLRITCNTPRALLTSSSQVVKGWLDAGGVDLQKMIDKGEETKLARLNEQLEAIQESGDQVLVFTHWTDQTLHLIKDRLTVPYLAHYGTTMTHKEQQRVRDDFKASPDITCLLTSDAGKEAMNMQNARYVIQYEPAYSYDTEMQRAGRINRADSTLEGLTNYVYVTEDSVEERVLSINRTRQLIAEAVQGTLEAMTTDEVERAQRTEAANLSWLIFGDRG